MRDGNFSPNHIGNDTAIFNLTADALRKRGCAVTVYSEQEFLEADITEGVVMAMCRNKDSVEKLKTLEKEGKLVVNSGFGIENCTRERMTRMLMGKGIPYPESIIVNTNENIRGELEARGMDRVWIKRGDQTIHREDVSYCRHPEEAQEVLHEYFYRGIDRAVINRHLEGEHLKFYGISGTDFFYCLYPKGSDPAEIVDIKKLKELCDRISEILDVKIYGGDCIVEADGNLKIIAFNDWPSFAPCRNEAAVAIAKTIYQLAGNLR